MSMEDEWYRALVERRIKRSPQPRDAVLRYQRRSWNDKEFQPGMVTEEIEPKINRLKLPNKSGRVF